MVVAERLVVRQVAGACPVVDREHEPGVLAADAAGRLDVLAGRLRLAGDDHRAESLDVDADRDHVRRQQHVDRPRLAVLALPAVLLRLARDPELVEHLRDVGGGLARGQLLEDQAAASLAAAAEHAALDVVLDQAAHPAQLAQRVEVTDQRHVRVGRGAGLAAEHRPRRLQLRDVHPDQHLLEPPAGRAHPQVAPPRSLIAILVGIALQREERVARVEPRRREDLEPAVKQPRNLIAGAADRRGRRDHLRPQPLAVDRPGAQLVDRRLVQADEAAERAADQMQLVLDDQVGRAQRLALGDDHGRQRASLGMRARGAPRPASGSRAGRSGARPARTAPAPAPPTASARTCRRSRSPAPAAAGTPLRRRPRPAGPRPGCCAA